MKTQNKSILLLIFFFLGVIIPLQLSTVKVNGATVLDLSTMDVSSNEVLPGGSIKVTVHAWNSTGPGPITGLDVDFTATDGNFLGTGLTTTTVTNSTGYAVVTWIAPFVNFNNDSHVVTITAHFVSAGVVKDQIQLVTVKHLDTTFIAGSEFVNPGAITFGETTELSVMVQNATNSPTEGMQVTVTLTSGNGTILDGTSDFEIDGLTDINGLFKFNWTSPDQPVGENETNVIFDIFIQAGTLSNLTIFGNILVTPYDATELTVSLGAFLEVESGQDITIDITITAGSFNAAFANVTLTVGSGEFPNGNDSILLTVDGNGDSSVIYTAPIILTNTTVTIFAQAELLSLTGQQTLDIDVYVIDLQFDVIMLFSVPQVKQDEPLTVTVTVTDSITTLPVSGANVGFSLELGVWVESDLGGYNILTNVQGVATATFDGSNTAMIKQIQEINVTAIITMDQYALHEIKGSFLLEKLPDTFNFTTSMSATTVDYGNTVVITITAEKNGVAYGSATIHFFATGGSFDDGSKDYRVQTNASGIAVVTWDSSSLPSLTDPLPVFIEIDLVNSGLNKTTVQIDVNPADITDGSTNTSTDDDPIYADPLVIGGVLGVVALVGTGAFLMRKK